MVELPGIAWLLLLAGAFALSVFGLRATLTVHDALRHAELDRLAPPPRWLLVRAFVGLCAAAPVFAATAGIGAGAFGAALFAGSLAFAAAPRFLAALRADLEARLLHDLPAHLELIALALESGSGLPAALAVAAERAPDGLLRRLLRAVVLEIHAGAEPLDALRTLEARLSALRFPALSAALRAGEKLGLPPADIVRERARHAAARRFARAERRARAAPLKLWATMMLCLAPCTLLVLAFPAAALLAKFVE